MTSPTSPRVSPAVRLLVALAVLVLVPALGSGTSASAAPRKSCTLSAELVPSCGVLSGAFVEPRTNENTTTAVTRFESQIDKKLNIVHTYHVGSKLFPTAAEMVLSNGGRTLFISWKPEGGHTWSQVAAGAADRTIDREAAYLKTHYTKKFFLAVHHEPEDEVRPAAGSGYTATDYRRMYQRVVQRFRAEGVSNAVFVMVYMGAQKQVLEPWFNSLWPGRTYVDWIAYDPYVTPSTNGQSGGFNWLANTHWGSNFTGMYNWIAKYHSTKPIMFGEWGVAEKPGDPSYKADLFRSTPRLLARYPKIKAMVYFDAPNARSGRVQLDTSTPSLNAYRDMVDTSAFY